MDSTTYVTTPGLSVISTLVSLILGLFLVASLAGAVLYLIFPPSHRPVTSVDKAPEAASVIDMASARARRTSEVFDQYALVHQDWSTTNSTGEVFDQYRVG